MEKPNKVPSYIEFHGLRRICARLCSFKKQAQDPYARTSTSSMRYRVPLNGGHNETFDLSKHNNKNANLAATDSFITPKSLERSGNRQDTSFSDLSSISSVTFHLRRNYPNGKNTMSSLTPRMASCESSSSSSFLKLSKISSITGSEDKIQTKSKYSLDNVAEDEHGSHCSSAIPGSPLAFYKDFLEREGLVITFRASNAIKMFYDEMECKESYFHTIRATLMLEDISLLRVMQEVGTSLNCCNNAGEGLLHLSCRFGLIDVTKFLLQEADVSARICDSKGRTPLHEAFLCQEPNMEIVELLIQKEPDLLLVRDERGRTPLEYIGKDQWASWADFLTRKQNILKPRHFTN